MLFLRNVWAVIIWWFRMDAGLTRATLMESDMEAIMNWGLGKKYILNKWLNDVRRLNVYRNLLLFILFLTVLTRNIYSVFS